MRPHRRDQDIVAIRGRKGQSCHLLLGGEVMTLNGDNTFQHYSPAMDGLVVVAGCVDFHAGFVRFTVERPTGARTTHTEPIIDQRHR